MAVLEFVEEKYGIDATKYLKNIRKGGDNNTKGSVYENFFAVSKICDIAANQSALNDFIISSQEDAFVDDICIRNQSDRQKTNYQAKNSSGVAANWNDEMEKRFRWQHEIDRFVHQFPSNRQILLVSCPEKEAENTNKIPSEIKEFCFSEYFPYYKSVSELVLSCIDLRSNLEKLCDSRDLSVIDAAFRLVLSSWGADYRPRSVGELIESAKAIARPNIFADFLPDRSMIPRWLLEKCNEFKGYDIRTEFSRFVISCNGLEVSLSAGIAEPETSVLTGLTNHNEFLPFLLSIAQEEFEK